MSNKQKSLINRLQKLEDKIFQATEGSFFKIQVSDADWDTIRQAKFLINRMCQKASE